MGVKRRLDGCCHVLLWVHRVEVESPSRVEGDLAEQFALSAPISLPERVQCIDLPEEVRQLVHEVFALQAPKVVTLPQLTEDPFSLRDDVSGGGEGDPGFGGRDRAQLSSPVEDVLEQAPVDLLESREVEWWCRGQTAKFEFPQPDGLSLESPQGVRVAQPRQVPQDLGPRIDVGIVSHP